MAKKIKAVVMAGGQGERFWPASTARYPKQFIDLTGDGTLIQQTVARLAQVVPYRDIHVVVSATHYGIARSQLPQVPVKNFIVEPVGRDTAACVALAALCLARSDPEAMMFVVPADHVIIDRDRFCDLAEAAVAHAESTAGLVTLGVRPTRPEIGYGYIELGERCAGDGAPIFHASRFVEKPDRLKAEEYGASGRHLWNTGMFAWSIPTIQRQIATHLPELHMAMEPLRGCVTDQELSDRLLEVFPTLPRISIDYGVMEHADDVFVVACDFGWDDLGSWNAVARIRKPDDDGNILSGLVLTEDCQNLLVESKGRLVATLGVRDLIVVETDDAVLVCARDRAQDIRKLASKAQEALEKKS